MCIRVGSWLRGLRQSHADEQKEHEAAITRAGPITINYEIDYLSIIFRIGRVIGVAFRTILTNMWVLIEAGLPIVERVLPEQFLEKIPAQRVFRQNAALLY